MNCTSKFVLALLAILALLLTAATATFTGLALAPNTLLSTIVPPTVAYVSVGVAVFLFFVALTAAAMSLAIPSTVSLLSAAPIASSVDESNDSMTAPPHRGTANSRHDIVPKVPNDFASSAPKTLSSCDMTPVRVCFVTPEDNSSSSVPLRP